MKNKFMTLLLSGVGLLGISLSLVACSGGSNEDPNTGNNGGNQNGGNQTVDFDSSKNIYTYTRDTESGTRDGFFTAIGLKDADSDNAPLKGHPVEVTGNDDMITKVKNDTYGIGYISLASYEDSGLTGLVYEGVNPNEENVINGSYKLTRNFNYVVRTEYKNDKEKQIVEAFRAFLDTKDAKITIKGNDGIVEIKDTDKSWDEIKENYPIASQDNKDVTIKIGGSTSCQKIAKALSKEFSSKCGNFVVEHDHKGSSDAYKRTQGSEKDGVNALHIGFASREFKLADSEKAAEGSYDRMCVDAIVAVVNPKNPMKEATKAQLKAIYEGTYKTWADVK